MEARALEPKEAHGDSAQRHRTATRKTDEKTDERTTPWDP
ncbi:hypothetical protein SBD_8120 [Streptomyces bottropensis ATCC 25435]|uniref:Uncharacterized protein n=1 Tax=Streptomyces bottropensis ATCC 25435 TaxID=1054862 RepID=M3E4J3_9ACTN|nr:hypothetical protein SBD_8120 [Streptomyces bottropensis ATCC 25435]